MAKSQTADDYFHSGAQHYIFGEKEKAKEAVQLGIEKFPTDPKLIQLASMLKREEKQQQQKQQSSKSDKDKKDSDDQKNPGQKGQQNDQNKKSAQEKQKEQEQAQKDKEKQAQQPKPNPSDQREQQPENAEQAKLPGQMSPAEARQLLAAQKDEEKALIFAPDKQPLKTQPGKFKDW